MSRVWNWFRPGFPKKIHCLDGALVKQWKYSEACPFFFLSGRSVCRRAMYSLEAGI